MFKLAITKYLLFTTKLTSMCLVLVSCVPRWSEDIGINKAWYDESDIYIQYTRYKSSYLEFLFPPDVVSGLTQNESYFLYRLPRANLSHTNTIIDLDDVGEQIDEKLIYKNKDFLIIGNVNVSKFDFSLATIKGRSKTATRSNCHKNWFLSSQPISTGKSLFYCGVLFEQSGNIITEVPSSIIHEFQQEIRTRLEKVSEWNPNLAINSAISNNRLLMLRENKAELANSIFSFAVWPLDNSSRLSWHIVELPIHFKFFSIDQLSYSPSGFIVLPHDHKQKIIFCQETKCDKLPILRGENYSYLMVDTARRELIEFKQEADSSSPKFKVLIKSF